MKKAFLQLMLCLFSLILFSRLVTLVRDFPVESTTPFEIMKNGCGRNCLLLFYMPVMEINKFLSPSDRTYIATISLGHPEQTGDKGERPN